MLKLSHVLAVATCCVITACSMTPTANKETAKTKSTKPNFVFIFADDHSPKNIAAFGNSYIKTPNLDELAAKGVTFTNAHNMGSWTGAVCLASRTMLNSGLSVWKAKQQNSAYYKKRGFEKTWSKLMEQQGYETYMTGKWHVAAPAKTVFQHVKTVRPGMPRDGWVHEKMEKAWDDLVAQGKTDSYAKLMPVGYNRPLSRNDHTWSPTDQKFGGYYEGGEHWSEKVKDEALKFIKQASSKDKPFFMYLAFNAPHDPRQAPQGYQDLYDADKLPLPNNWLAKYPEQNLIENGPSLRDAALAPFPRTEYSTKVHLKEYYALISHLDHQIGIIMDALKASGKLDNTYIVYTADHGLSVGEHGLFGKQNMYDCAVRAPYIIIGPDLQAGKTVDRNIYLQDTMATALDVAKAKKPEHVFFNSVLPLARGETDKSSYPAIYGAYTNSQRMVKQDGFKLIVYPKANKLKLFDLQKDPDEMVNLADKPAYKAKVRKLFNELLKLQVSLGDELDISEMAKLI